MKLFFYHVPSDMRGEVCRDTQREDRTEKKHHNKPTLPFELPSAKQETDWRPENFGDQDECERKSYYQKKRPQADSPNMHTTNLT